MQLYEPTAVGDRLHIDLTGPHPPSRQGAQYILTAVDGYSRFLICVPLRNKQSLTVAQALVDHVFVSHGSYRAIVSDQGSDFNCELLTGIARPLGVQQLTTTSCRPSANGRVEIVHRTINDLMAKVISESQRDWQDRLGLITAAYNAAHHEATGFSPFSLMYGRCYCTPIDLAMNGPEVPYGPTVIGNVD
jgi:transposase InsO family protein